MLTGGTKKYQQPCTVSIIFQLLSTVREDFSRGSSECGCVKVRLSVWFIIILAFHEHVHGAKEADGHWGAFFTDAAMGKYYSSIYS